MSKIGKNIKKIRNIKGLSQQAFAELFDLTRGNISSYEEMRAEPKIDTLFQIAKYFGISLEDFIGKELSVNELLNYNTELVLETDKLKRANQFVEIPYISNADIEDYISNYEDDDFMKCMPKLHMPSSSKQKMLAIEVTDTEGFPLNHNYKLGDILIFEKLVKENMHRVSEKLGVKVSAEGVNIGIYQREKDDIYLILNEWVKYSCQDESNAQYWVLRALYTQLN